MSAKPLVHVHTVITAIFGEVCTTTGEIINRTPVQVEVYQLSEEALGEALVKIAEARTRLLEKSAG